MKQQYKYIKNLLSNDLVEFLSSRSLNVVSKGSNRPDAYVPLSQSFHSSESEIYYHITHFLLPKIEKETDLKLKPIYSFNRIYFSGANLKKHKDRPQCEISVSITLKYFYEDKNYKWPLCLGDKPIAIEKGDGVIYKGCEVEHWRPYFTQPKTCWHHQLFIHYVNLNGPYKDLKEEVYE
jgi:hypothetical protein